MKIVTHDNYKIGDKVVRGKDWSWEDQDKNSAYGVIVEPLGGLSEDWVGVQWKNGRTFDYRVGDEDRYDLYFYEEKTLSLVEKEARWNEILRKATECSAYKAAPPGYKFKALTSYLAQTYDVPNYLITDEPI